MAAEEQSGAGECLANAAAEDPNETQAAGEDPNECSPQDQDAAAAAAVEEDQAESARDHDAPPAEDEHEIPENEAPAAAAAQSKERDMTPLLMGRVKKIIRLDKEIKLVSRPALSAITHAARMFMETLTTQAFSEMLRNKHRSLRLADMEAAVRKRREYLDFLDDCMDIFAPATKNNSDGSSSEDEDDEQQKKNEKPAPPPGTRCITEYFSKNSVEPVEENVEVTPEDEDE